MVEVRRVSDRVMTVVVVCEDDVLRLICGYATQGGRSLEEKQSFYDELEYEWDMRSVGELVMCLSDINGHVGRHTDGFNGVHEGHGVRQRNLEGRMSNPTHHGVRQRNLEGRMSNPTHHGVRQRNLEGRMSNPTHH